MSAVSEFHNAITAALGYTELNDAARQLRLKFVMEDQTFWTLWQRNYDAVGYEGMPDGGMFQFTLENLTESERQALHARIEARAAAQGATHAV